MCIQTACLSIACLYIDPFVRGTAYPSGLDMVGLYCHTIQSPKIKVMHGPDMSRKSWNKMKFWQVVSVYTFRDISYNIILYIYIYIHTIWIYIYIYDTTFFSWVDILWFKNLVYSSGAIWGWHCIDAIGTTHGNGDWIPIICGDDCGMVY